MERFIRLFGADCIDCLVADRDFIGKEWIGWLNNRRIRYYLRIRQKFWLVKPSTGERIRAWWLFNDLNIEDTHMRDIERIARLVAMVRVALVWAYLVGEHKYISIKPIRILKYGRKAKSLVKFGLEEIDTILMRPTCSPKFEVFKFLSCI